MLYEISKKAVQECGSIKKAIAAGAYNIWDPERVKLAFHSGRGSEKDFLRYMIDNMPFCYFLKPSDIKYFDNMEV